MKRLLLCFVIIFRVLILQAQPSERIYLLPGQGSDERIYSALSFDSNIYEVVQLSFTLPKKGESMKSYAQRFIPQIDTTLPYSFVGVSLGGMIAVELQEMMRPQHTIILSSAKHRNEIPLGYRTQRVLPIYRIIPSALIKASAFVVQPLFEPDRRSHKSTFKSMLKDKEAKFLKRAITLIVRWDRESSAEDIIHIHGENDHTLPIRNIDATYVVKDGSHMMTLTRAEEIQALLDRVLVSEIEIR